MPTVNLAAGAGESDIGWGVVRVLVHPFTGERTGLEIRCKSCGLKQRFMLSDDNSNSTLSVFQHTNDCRVLAQVKRREREARAS
ncbi:MAG: hypothetical protein ACE149_19610 [Armatimonadota bacterium]